MDWNETYQKISGLQGVEPYACSESNTCNHVAKSNLWMMVHHYLGTHHLNH